MADFTVNGNINSDDVNPSDVESAINSGELVSSEELKKIQDIFRSYVELQEGGQESSKILSEDLSKLYESLSTNEESESTAALSDSFDVETALRSLIENNPEIGGKNFAFALASAYIDAAKKILSSEIESLKNDPEKVVNVIAEKAYQLSTTDLEPEVILQQAGILDAPKDIDEFGNKTLKDALEDAEFKVVSDNRELIESPQSSMSSDLSNQNQMIIYSPPTSIKPYDFERSSRVDYSRGVGEEDIYDAEFTVIGNAAARIESAAELLNKSSDTFEDAVNNAAFSSGGGDGGGTIPPIDTSGTPDDDGEKSPLDRILSLIAGRAGRLGVAAYLTKLVSDTFNSVLNTLGNQANYFGQVAAQSIGNPQAVSPIQPVLQPIAGAGQAVGALGGLAGAGLGTLIAPGIGTIAGGVLGSIIGDKFSASITGVVDILLSIDQGIQSLGISLRPFSPDIIAASVEASLDRLESRFKQAEELGPLIADNIQARSEFELAVRDLGTELAKLFLPTLTGLTNIGTKIVESIDENFTSIVERVKAAFQAVYNSLSPYMQSVVQSILSVLNIISANTKTAQGRTSSAQSQIQNFLMQSATSVPAGVFAAPGVGPSFPYFKSMGVNF